MTAPSPAPTGALRFGAFSLDPRSGALHGPHGRASLPDQPLKVLLTLLEQPGELVTREALRQRLWPDNTFVDFEHGLNAAVKRLRDALGDAAEAPEYIETVPRRGYRLIAAVDSPPAAPAVLAPSPAAVTQPAAAGAWRPRVALPLVAALVAVAAVSWYALEHRSASPSAPSARHLTRVTFGAGLDTDVAWSPDGQRIAYASDRSGNFDIWVQPSSGGEPSQLTTSPAADSQPAWSPTGDLIVFRSERDGGGLFTVPASGGVARRLTTFGYRPTWMPEGREVLFAPADVSGSAEAAPALHAVVPDGATPPRELLRDFLEGGRWYWFGSRPDGRVAVIGDHPIRGFGLFSLRPDGSDMTQAVPPPDRQQAFGLTNPHPRVRCQWSGAGSALYLEVVTDSLSSVWRIPARSDTVDWNAAERLTTGPANVAAVALSPDGRRLAFTSGETRRRAWVFPFDAIAGRILGAGRPVTDDALTVGSLSILPPDGKALLHEVSHTGRDYPEIAMTDIQTGATRAVVPNAYGPVASPGGDAVAYALVRRGAGTRSGDTPPADEFATAVRDWAGSEQLISGWSADRLFLPSDWRADGTALLGSYFPHVRSAPPQVDLVLWSLQNGPHLTPAQVLLSQPGRQYWQATYSPDQRFISFVVANSARPGEPELGLLDAAATSRSWTRIAADHTWPDKPRWAPDGRTLYFVSRKASSHFNLWGVRIDTTRGAPAAAPVQITGLGSSDLEIDPDMASLDIAVLGNRLVLTIPRRAGSIWVMSNADR